MGEYDQAPPAKGGSMKWIVAGCCGCLLLGVVLFFVLGGLGIMKGLEAVKAYKTEAETFLQEASTNPDTAYARFSEPLKKVQSLEQFKAGVQGNPDLFAAQSVDFTGINVDGVSGETKLTGTVTSKTGKVRQCTFTFIEEGGVKKLIGYHISDQ